MILLAQSRYRAVDHKTERIHQRPAFNLMRYQSGDTIMSKLLYMVLGASLGFAISAPLYAAVAPQSTEWSDAQVRNAMDKCKSLTGTERAKCIVNIRPAGGGGSSLAVGVSDEKTVKSGNYTEEEYMAAVKTCESANVSDKDRCMADAKDHYGRM
jgi:hypothetical protein